MMRKVRCGSLVGFTNSRATALLVNGLCCKSSDTSCVTLDHLQLLSRNDIGNEHGASTGTRHQNITSYSQRENGSLVLT